jgi:hypothetical protein
MSAIWKIGLFKKLSATEAECLICQVHLQMKNFGTTGLVKHANTHEEYAAKLKKFSEKQEAEKNAMDRFVKVLPQGFFFLCAYSLFHRITT